MSKVMSGPGNPFVFNQMDYLMGRIKKEDTLNKYHMLLKSGRVILEDYWCWHGHEWYKALVKCLNDFYIVIILFLGSSLHLLLFSNGFIRSGSKDISLAIFINTLT